MMEFLWRVLDFILHIDVHLLWLVKEFGVWSYCILFLIIFLETGLVITPLLPGDSLLFAVGAMAAAGSLDIWIIYLLLCSAAILGDTVNYWVGYYLGPKVFHEKSSFFNREYLEKTHHFYEEHGGKTIIIARFIPIVRTFAPFVAGIGRMNYIRFVLYNVVGGIIWVSIFTFGGYYFGNIPFVKEHFSLVLLVIIGLSIVPAITEYVKRHKKKKIVPV